MDYRDEVEETLRNLAKPPGSLGLLEKQVKQIFLAWGKMYRELKPKHIIFAADNGVVWSGAAAQPPEITYLQTKNMVDGLAAVSCFCNCNNIPYEVVDVGIDSPDAVGLNYKIRQGTRNFAVEPAMTKKRCGGPLISAENVWSLPAIWDIIFFLSVRWALAIRRLLPLF